MDRAFFLTLSRMERLNRIGIIVRQHAERIGRLAPFLLTQRLDRLAIPFHRCVTSAAPFAVFNVQNVVLEILEIGIRRLGALEQIGVMLEQQVLPITCILALQQLQRVERDKVMGRATPVRDDDKLEQIHGQPP